MSKTVNIQIENHNGSSVVILKEPSITDDNTITWLHKQIEQLIEDKQPAKIIIDFKSVKFFSSQLLGMLLALHSKLKLYDAEIIISAIEPRLHKIFKITNLDKIFRFFLDVESALKAQKSQPC